MNKKKLHSNFKLNGFSFLSSDELLSFTKNERFVKIHQFLDDWFSAEDVLKVKTSGSTGVPKTIKLRKEFMINSAIVTGNYFNLPQKSTALLCLPIEYIAGKMMFIRALVLGWHLDFFDSNSKPLESITKKYDFTAMVPLQVENSLHQLHLVKKLIVGGGVVSSKLQDKLQNIACEVFATYGMTESITHIAVKKLNRIQQLPNFYHLLPSVKIYKDNKNCLVIEAKNISEKVLFTNDVVQLISENQFDWLGRLDNVINSGGVKLHPEIIEKKLTEIIENRFFVYGVFDDILGEKLILIIEFKGSIERKNSYLTKLQYQIKNLTSLDKFEIPKEIYFLDTFKETSSGKIQRNQTLASLE